MLSSPPSANTDIDGQDAQQLRTLLSRVAQTAHRELITPEEEDC